MRALVVLTLLVSGCYASHERDRDASIGADAALPIDASVPVDAFVPVDASVCGDPIAAVIEIPEGGGCREIVVPTTIDPDALACGFGTERIEGASVLVRNLHDDRLHLLTRSRADDPGGEICFLYRDGCECVPGGGCASGGDLRLHGIGEVLEREGSREVTLILDNEGRPAWLRACSPPR